MGFLSRNLVVRGGGGERLGGERVEIEILEGRWVRGMNIYLFT